MTFFVITIGTTRDDFGTIKEYHTKRNKENSHRGEKRTKGLSVSEVPENTHLTKRTKNLIPTSKT